MKLNQVLLGDATHRLPLLPQADLIFTSPPYEDARVNCGSLKGDKWVSWAVEIFLLCYQNCKGLTAWVVNGRTKNFQSSMTPILLMAELHRQGVKLRKPPLFHRVGIPGSGGPDWLRDDYEFIICASKGKLPWSDSVACGHPPKFEPGGEPSHRNQKGERVNRERGPSTAQRNAEGPHRVRRRMQLEGKLKPYRPPAVANPGNVLTFGAVGGGNMGSKLCHEHPAPFPESLAEFFIKSFCPPGGLVVDCFCGSGTTLAVAKRLGRNYIGIDINKEYCALSERRLRCEEEARVTKEFVRSAGAVPSTSKGSVVSEGTSSAGKSVMRARRGG